MSFDYLEKRLQKLRADFRFRELVPRSTNGVYLVDADGQQLINFGSNDYLGIAADQTLSTATSGSAASALVSGWSTMHQALADRIARFEETESAVVFPSGFAACSGTIAALAEDGDLILSDELNHASLIDGCRLSRAQRFVVSHRQIDQANRLLSDRRAEFNRVWIVTDSVFSMDGHVAPLEQWCDVADRWDANIIVDEAHATGVLGKRGRGACEALGVKDRVPIRIGTLSKAIGAQGGFVAGPKSVIDYLINHCRSLIYTTALAPSSVQAAMRGITLICDEPQRREHVQRLARLFREQMADAQPANHDDIETRVPIIPVILGDDQRAVAASRLLYKAGFLAPTIRPPTVPEGTARLRISISAAHNQEMVESLVATIRRTLR